MKIVPMESIFLMGRLFHHFAKGNRKSITYKNIHQRRKMSRNYRVLFLHPICFDELHFIDLGKQQHKRSVFDIFSLFRWQHKTLVSTETSFRQLIRAHNSILTSTGHPRASSNALEMLTFSFAVFTFYCPCPSST